jgi:hypothetical protein
MLLVLESGYELPFLGILYVVVRHIEEGMKH